MNKLRAIHLFTRVADLGNFAAVANEMGVTASMISKEIQKLEKDVGARLLHRSTRKLQLTATGEGYLVRSREIIAQVDDADAYVSQMHHSMQGKLRINIPMVLGVTDISKVMADFMNAFPQVKLDIHLGDEALDLVEHGFDLGFRASSQPFDSHYVGKPLKNFSYHICASPEYVKRHAKIIQPKNLEQHNCFIYSYFKRGSEWPVDEGVRVEGNLKVNNTLFMKEAVLAGLGIGFLPSFVVEKELKAGHLIELLREHKKPNLTLYALYPNRKHSPPILTKCIEFLEKWFNQ